MIHVKRRTKKDHFAVRTEKTGQDGSARSRGNNFHVFFEISYSLTMGTAQLNSRNDNLFLSLRHSKRNVNLLWRVETKRIWLEI